jgi:hypothetical protein
MVKDGSYKSEFELRFHKMIVVGFPHLMQNNDFSHHNKMRGVCFTHICRIIRDFIQLCI